MLATPDGLAQTPHHPPTLCCHEESPSRHAQVHQEKEIPHVCPQHDSIEVGLTDHSMGVIELVQCLNRLKKIPWTPPEILMSQTIEAQYPRPSLTADHHILEELPALLNKQHIRNL
jgi:hypothetical protein